MTTLKIAVFALVLFSGPLFGVTIVFPQQELDALQAILGAWNTNTPNLEENLAGWNSTHQIPCDTDSWQGVLCQHRTDPNHIDNYTSVVVGLTLEKRSIVGTLPPEIGNLTNLAYLSLTGNPGLSGPLPKEIGNLTSLNILRLSDNNFNGSIPDLQSLSQLQELDLSGNQFAGQLPNLGDLIFLRTMSFSGNQLSDTIFNNTNSYGLVNLTELVSMDLSNNSMKGAPPNLTSMAQLKSLNLSGNNFSGSVEAIFHLMARLTILDLSENNIISPIPDLNLFSALQHLSLSNINFGDVVPDWLQNLTQLQTLSLQRCNFSGNFPYTLVQKLTQLQTLALDDNNLNGTLNVDLYAYSSANRSLQVLSILNNRITNVQAGPKVIMNLSIVIKLEGNPFCSSSPNFDAGHCYCIQLCYIQPVNNPHDENVIIISSVVASGAMLGFVILTGVILFSRSRRNQRYLLLQVEQKFAEFEVKPTIFTYNELRIATKDFHPSTKLGQGSYGVVFKGKLASGMEVAVKQLFVKTQQGIDEFLNEVVLITGVKHRNLVKLRGCCVSGSRRLLVYEYVENYDLAETLFEGKGGHVLNWSMWLDICLGIARGLQYLHEIAQPRIIHRDIKASNILLDQNLQAKIADFGLALLFPDNKTHISTLHVAGTKGYLAPEYASRGQLTEKADVFSFGVLVLEVVSGRRNIDPKAPVNEIYLIEKVWRLHTEDKLMDLVDPKLHGLVGDVAAVQRTINVALLCLLIDAERRPSMARCVSYLQGEADLEVVVKNINTTESNKLYEKLVAVAGFGASLATVAETTPFTHGPSSSVVSSTSNNTASFELSVVNARD